jgi:hypothetical protein
MKERNQKMKNTNETKEFGMTGKARKAAGALLLAGGLFGTQAHAAVTAAPSTIPNRVAAVRAEMNKRVAEAQTLGGQEATKLPYAQTELASWLNWYNWPNWNNWGNWANWSNWFNF